MRHPLFFSAVLLVLLVCIAVVQCSVVQVIVVSRHCDRTPISKTIVPKSPIDWKKKFGLSPGQLTGLGISQCQEMGATLRQRYLEPSSEHYITNITQHFDSDMFKLYSTSVDRTIISLNSASQGLFPNGTGLINDITNQPSLPNDITMVPVHTFELSQDVLLRAYEKCPKIKTSQDDFKKSKQYQELMAEYDPLLQNIHEWTGLAKGDLSDFYFTYDLLNTQKSHNLLTLEPVLKEWDKIESLGMYTQYLFFNRLIQNNLGAGPLVDTIYNTFEKTVQTGGKAMPKYIHYSAHDTTLQSLMATLDLSHNNAELRNIPPYGSQAIFELHKDDQNKYSVQVVIRLSHTGDNFVAYKLPKLCTSTMCDWKQFTQYLDEVSRLSAQNWCHKCGNENTGVCVTNLLKKTRSQNTVILVSLPIIGAALLISLSILLIIVVWRLSQRKTKTTTAYREANVSLLGAESG